MRVLVIDTVTKEAVRKVVDFASKEANWYNPLKEGPIPGNNPNHCVYLNKYRCVFSLTKMEDVIYRHLSVSIQGEDELPHPTAFDTIAQLFGFPPMDSNTHQGYEIAHKKEEGCIVAAFPITKTQ